MEGRPKGGGGSFADIKLKERWRKSMIHNIKTEKIGRPVRVVSIGFDTNIGESNKEEVYNIVDAEGVKGADIIILPETWRGQQPEPIDGDTVHELGALSKKNQVYIICPIYRLSGQKRYNSAILLDRQGQVACVYDKVYPYWSEFDLEPPVEPGKDSPVFETDFGRIGMAICFDSNFPEVWKRMADQGAELILWPSAYSAGTTLQAHALNNHYYIVTSTLEGDCLVYDITGKEILYEKSGPINVSRITLDLDRGIYHENFNTEKREQLLAAYPDGIMQEIYMKREQWFVLCAKRPGISARELAKSFGLEELRAYQNRSRTEIDKMRYES